MDTSALNFIDLTAGNVAFLLFVGFVGGMVSGFIGSGGAFVLTPAMMSMGVPGIVAVASNICHKFPKALVGAIKRHKFGHIDLKLGVILGLSAEAGMLWGAGVQQGIKQRLGDAGSNLYVSVAFVVVLGIVGTWVALDAIKLHRRGTTGDDEEVTRLARWVHQVKWLGPRFYSAGAKAHIPWLITLPIGFCTGLLASTIAVGGFVGVPSMHYVLGVPSMMASATELVIAFIMGLGGTIKFGWGGYVDLRLAMVILAGSLFGIQLGAIGTTYVKPYMVKVVMAVIMVLVLLSRGFIIPVYLAQLGWIAPIDEGTAALLKGVSFWIMVAALVSGAVIVLGSLVKGMQAHAREQAGLSDELAHPPPGAAARISEASD
jgi:hypothetical protein